MHERQETVNDKWRGDGLPEFGLGIGLSTGEVAAALLGSDERLEYTLVGDTVNLAQRLQDLARPPGTVMSGATLAALPDAPAVDVARRGVREGTGDTGGCVPIAERDQAG